LGIAGFRLVLIATTTGNVQRALRSKALPQALRGSKPLPPELAVPISPESVEADVTLEHAVPAPL
jgi:hypothetical protein